MTSTYLQTAIEDAMGREASATVSGALELGKGAPFVARAVDQCWERLEQFRRSPNATDNPARVHAQAIQRESGVTLDSNVYTGITKPELEAVVRAAFNSHQPPEVLLALWAKEGSTRSVDAPWEVPGAGSAANAKTLFRSTVFFVHLGIDHFVVVTAHAGQDNQFDPSDAAAPGHERHFQTQVRALVTERLLSEDVSAAINAELTVTPTASGGFAVQPSTRFYALALLLVDALFERHLRQARVDVPGASPALAYMHWNMRLASWNQFVPSAERHRAEPRFTHGGQPISIEQWALHTPPRNDEFGQARRNAIRLMHYIESYRPIFESAMTLITPGIEDLHRETGNTRTAAFLAGALDVPIEGYVSDPTGTACATGPQPGARALVTELGHRWGGRGEIFNCRPVRGGSHLSLHGEGRAVDWYRTASDPAQAAEAQQIIDWLLATDAAGNEHALARRMGVQEIIWNHRIWTARRHAEGWRAYSGPDPHTSHLHIGLNWAGARKQTSYWTQQAAAATPVPAPAAGPPAAQSLGGDGTGFTLPPGTVAVPIVTFGSAADIDAYFTSHTGSGFLDWFHTTQGNRGAWAAHGKHAGRTTKLDRDTRTRFATVWDRMSEIFGTPRISLWQFVALQSIFINELGGGMAPISEGMGSPGHPGMAYLFDAISGVKQSYNHAPNKTALDCFNNAAFITAHGSLPGGSRLAHTTNAAWGGEVWPAGEESSMARAPFVSQADFCKFRGRGMIQSTWRPGYAKIVDHIKGYSGTNACVLTYKGRWTAPTQDVLYASSNEDWDTLFQGSDYVIPFAGIRLHNAAAGNYLDISTDATIRSGTAPGSFYRMGLRISGSKGYASIFKDRCLQVLTALASATPPAAAVPAAPPAAGAAPAAPVSAHGLWASPLGDPTGPPPSSSLTWAGSTPEQLAFMQSVYDTHVRRSARGRRFVANVPAAELGPIEAGAQARRAAAEHCRALLANARVALAAAQAAGDAHARSVERISIVSAYRSVSQQFASWQRLFPRYYRETQTQRQALPGGEHGEQAAEMLARHIGAVLGAPGYSLHNDGLAIDFGTREASHDLGASTAHRRLWRASWLFEWLMAHGASCGFHQNTSIDEPWHWEYRGVPAGTAPAPAVAVVPAAPAAQGLAAYALGTIAAGQADVPTVAMLASHHDRGPDMVLRWNAIADPSAGIDVVVHLHGFSTDRRLDLRQRKLPLSGLDFAPPVLPASFGAPAQPPWTGRTRQSLLVLPRGKAREGHGMAYDFPALTREGAFAELVRVALLEFASCTGLSAPPPLRRLILTGHSGGGAPVDRILARIGDGPGDPHEVHVFDGLYGDPSGLRGWVDRRLRRDVAALGSAADAAVYMATGGGGLRVLHTAGVPHGTTRPNSLALQAYVGRRIPTGMPFTETLQRHYRVEPSAVAHTFVPVWYGGRLLADVTATIPGPVHH
jgi:hypothetical protein